MTMSIALQLAAVAACMIVIAVQLFRMRNGGPSRQRHAATVISGSLQLVCAVFLAASAVKHDGAWRLFNVAATALCLYGGLTALQRSRLTREP